LQKASIGTRNESSLHRALKFQYAGQGGETEVPAGDFIADGISASGEYIEVQTGSFAPLVKKVKDFASLGKVRIIHPIAVTKIIKMHNEKGVFLYRRKSPLKGSAWDIFDALLHAPLLPLTKGVTIELVMLDVTEIRVKDGKGSWRRKGASIKNRELSAWHEKIVLKKPKDYLTFIPFRKGEEFTVSSLAKKAGIQAWKARRALYVLTKMQVIKRIGKKRNAWVYIK